MTQHNDSPQCASDCKGRISIVLIMKLEDLEVLHPKYSAELDGESRSLL
jgi:hypothetical protein